MLTDAGLRFLLWIFCLTAFWSTFGFLFPLPEDSANANLYWFSVVVVSIAISAVVWLGSFMQHVVEPKRGDSRTAFIIISAIGFAALPLVLMYAISNDWDGNKLGTLGDFFGGILNPILTFLTFVGLLITIVLQQREIHNAKVDAQAAEERTARQQFETTFFQMLSLHDSIVNSMDLRTRASSSSTVSGMEWHGRDCFPRFYTHLQNAYKGAKNAGVANPLRIAYDEFWKQDQKDLAHYFRFLYNIIRVMDEANVDKKIYIRLLRAQISDYELLILFYNGMFNKGRHFRVYIEKYALFDNLPEELLLEISDQASYSDDAYFDKKIVREDPQAFLDKWVTSYVFADAREPSDLETVIDELLVDAKESGVTRVKLERAAGGNLRAHILAALKKARGED